MNFESVRNIMDDEQHHKQAKEPYEVEGRDYAVTCQTCNSNGMSQRVFPTSSYHPCMYIYNYSDWEICEELRLQELKEVKARAAQMEKTMRWWSDCTANWREKWSKVRVERNKAREEGRQLKLKLEATMKELSALKKINHGSLSENEVEAGNIWKKNFGSPESGSFWMKEYHLGPLEKTPSKYVQNNKISEALYENENASGDHQDVRSNLESLDSGCDCTASSANPNPSQDNPIHSQSDEVIRMSGLHLHLYDMKRLQKEQKIRSSLEKEIEKLKSETTLWKWKYEELRKSNWETLKQNEVENIVEDLEENTEASSQKNVKIWELQTEMERLQSENAAEREKKKTP